MIIFIASFIAMFIFILYIAFRNEITYKYTEYWNYVIYQYQIYCLNNNKEPEVSYIDMVKYDDFIWDLSNFDRDSLIIDKQKLKILKKFLESGARSIRLKI